MHHLRDWQTEHAQADLAALQWTTLTTPAIHTLVQALIRDQLHSKAPALSASQRVADLLLGLPESSGRSFMLQLPVWHAESGELHQIEICARLERESLALSLPDTDPELTFLPETSEEAQALEALRQDPARTLEGAHGLLARLTPGSVAQAVQHVAGRFPHETALVQAELLAAGLTAWAFARSFQSMDCEIELVGLVSEADPSHGYRLTLEARETEGTFLPTSTRRH